LREGTEPRNQTVRRIRPEWMPKVKTMIDQYVEQGVLERVSKARFAAPLVLIEKNDGDLRMAVDYKELNSCLEANADSIPAAHDLFPSLAHKGYYGKVDNTSGYHQLRVDEETKRLTTITTPWGL